MSAWAYVCLPETKGYALEDIKYLFEQDVIIRSLQDAPGGKVFLRGRQVPPVELLKERHGRLSAGEGRADDQDPLEHTSSRDSSLKQTPSV